MHKENPYLKMPNPWNDYNKNMDEMIKHHPEITKLSRICYEIFFVSKNGKELLSILENRILNANLVNPNSDNLDKSATYWMGYADCVKMLRTYGLEHKKISEG